MTTRPLSGNQWIVPPTQHERVIPHTFLKELYGKAVAFNEDNSDMKATYLASQIGIVADVLGELDSVSGVFGLGYPFYGFWHDGRSQKVPPVPEISRFIGEKSSLIELDAERNVGAWACAACQIVNRLPDLKSVCRYCDQTDLKPREPFKAMLDLDFIVVVDESSPLMLDEISQGLLLAGFTQSDSDIFHSLMATSNAFDLVLKDEVEHSIRGHDHNLPLDIHVVDKPTLLDAISQIGEVPGSGVEIFPQSLRAGWVDNPEAINLGFDFLFSLTGSLIRDAELAEVVKNSRQKIGVSMNSAVISPSEMVAAMDSRAARILVSPIHRKILDKRVLNWVNEPFSDMEEIGAKPLEQQ